MWQFFENDSIFPWQTVLHLFVFPVNFCVFDLRGLTNLLDSSTDIFLVPNENNLSLACYLYLPLNFSCLWLKTILWIFFALVKCILGNENIHFRSLKLQSDSWSFSFEKSYFSELIAFLATSVNSEMSYGKFIIFSFLPNHD